MQKAEDYTTDYSKTTLSFDQDKIYRQDNFPRGRTFRIYPPSRKQDLSPQSHNFNIATIANKPDLMVSNLPLVEKARMQKYDIKCNAKNYSLMIEATKYIFDAYSFNFESNDHEFIKTHYFSIAPNLQSEYSCAKLPNIFRTSVCRDVDNPKHFSFSSYAIVGGYYDGFYFLSRLDNNVHECAHVCHDKRHKAPQFTADGRRNKHRYEVIDFPHMHQPQFSRDMQGKQEFCTPHHLGHLVGRNMHYCLDYYMKFHNISSNMLLVQDDMKIDSILSCAKYFDQHHTLEECELGALGKVALANFGQYETYTEQNLHQGTPPKQESGAPYLRP